MKRIKKILSVILALVLVTGMGLVLPGEAKAASFSVSSSLTSDLQAQQFYLSNPGGEELYYDVQQETSLIEQGVPLTASKTLSFRDINAYYVVYLYNMEGEEVSAVSPATHGITVSYNVGGQVIPVYSDQINQGESFTYDADEYYMLEGKEYRIKSGESASQVLEFGKAAYIFNYELYEPEPVTASVHYVDASGNEIGGESKAVGYYDKVTFDVPGSLSVDGREYEKASSMNRITVNYFSPQLEYDVEYRMKGAPQEGPYSVEILYEGEDKTVLGNRFYTVNPEDGKIDLPEQPTTLSARNGGTITYYEAVDSTKITHDASGDVRQYVIKYRVSDQKSPYQWSIRLVNAANGNILDTISKEIPAEGSKSYDVESIIKVSGKNYILDGGMQKQYTHQYGENRILNIYYNEEGKDAVSSYDLNIRYKSVSTDEVLFETKAAVTPEAQAVIEAPENYQANEKEFVKLSGQENAVTHDFYNPQRNYTIYYRDINDLQNVDTIVTQEEIVTSENLITRDVITDAGTDAQTVQTNPTQVTVLTNPTTGELVTLNEEGVPLAGEIPDTEATDNKDTVSSKDEKVPLGKGGLPALAATAMRHPLASGIVLAALIAVFGVGGYFFHKKRQNKAVQETGTEE